MTAQTSTTAHCLAPGCPWVPLGSTWTEVDRAAQAHSERAPHHPTQTVTTRVATPAKATP